MNNLTKRTNDFLQKVIINSKYVILIIFSILFFNCDKDSKSPIESNGDENESRWTSQESPTTYNLNCVFFIDHNNGWIVGDNGVILNTTNGGETWVIQPSGLSTTLSSVHFANSDFGWIVGGSGTILNTSDGGINWNDQSFGITGILNDVFFINADTGWATSGSYVYNTKNGGEEWIDKSPQYNYYPAPPSFKSIYFHNYDNGWISGSYGTILRTTNHGNSWVFQRSGYIMETLYDIYFINSNIGWTVGRTDTSTILYTTNSGDTWDVKPSVTKWRLNSIYFIDLNTGWVVGDGGLIFHASDGGENWHAQSSGINVMLNSVYFTDSLNGWAVGNDGIILYTNTGGI